ncbi:MAG: glycine cleavage system protein GcvH [Gammaproteobacteria bacterium]|nr:glycine cleavage system protein GcvH [Gammaproteobacteria bacterium]MCP5009586.1 glycine cleavage system protein GcvH [Aestuariibacter sp.]
MSTVKFTEDHEWVRIEGDGSATIGITNHAQEQLGDLVFVELPEIERELEKGEEAAVIESVKSASELKSPVGGTVVAVNEALAEDPALVNGDAMGDGWFYRLQPGDLSELDELLDDEAYGALID